MRSGWAKITKAGDSLASWFTQQITYRKKVSNVTVVYPYGYHANATVDKSLVLWFAVNGDSENKAGIPFDFATRPDLKEGEVAMYHPETNTIIKFDLEGKIVLNTDTDLSATVGGKLIANVAGDTELTTPNLIVNGNLSVTGTIVSDTSVAAPSILADGKELTGHAHLQPDTAPTATVQGNTLANI